MNKYSIKYQCLDCLRSRPVIFMPIKVTTKCGHQGTYTFEFPPNLLCATQAALQEAQHTRKTIQIHDPSFH